MADKDKTLYHLDDLSGYKVASGYPDVMGWEVLDANHKSIGTVDRLLVNKNTERVVYLEVEVNENLTQKGHDTYEEPADEGVHQFLNKEGETHLIIPIGLARVDEDNNKVITDSIDDATFAKVKRRRKGEDFDFEYERDVVRTYNVDSEEDQYESEEDFYNRREFENIYRKGDTDPKP